VRGRGQLASRLRYCAAAKKGRIAQYFQLFVGRDRSTRPGLEELVKEQGLEIRFSLGIASYDQSMSREKQLIRKAEAALHRAISVKESVVYL